MSHADYRPARLFTVDQANSMLPLVRAIVSDLSRLSCDVVERQRRLAFLTAQRGSEKAAQDVYSDELSQIQRELEKEKLKLREYVTELEQLGVEPKSATEGLVDFPTEIDGRLALLCWKLGEPEVLYWHDLESGFAGRQPLTANSLAGDEADEHGAHE